MNTPELLACVRTYLALHHPGLVPSHLTVAFFNQAAPLQLPIGPALAPTADAASQDERGGPRISPCAMDILDVLEAAGKPLATTALLAALARAGKEWSRSHVEKHLADMVRDGTLENPESARPRGYRLPE